MIQQQFILLIYGLSFFSLGIAIWIYPWRDSSFILARNLWPLTAFAVLHGIGEWMSMLDVPRPHETLFLEIIGAIVIPLSFIALIQFAAKTITETKKGLDWLKSLPVILSLGWIIWAVTAKELLYQYIGARYLLCIPGAGLAAYALYLQSISLNHIPRTTGILRTGAAAFAIYAVVGGLIVPRAPFFPASILNYSRFLQTFGFPIQILRAGTAVVITVSMIKTLAIFDWESRVEKEAKQAALISLETERKRLSDLLKIEALVHQTEKLAAIGQLAAGVAHEVNNPLGVILGFAQAMARSTKAGEPLHLPIISIEREALRCKKLVQNLLTFSRTSDPKLEKLDFNQTVIQACSLIAPQAKLTRVEVRTDLAEDLPMIMGNAGQLDQIIFNLAKNGIDAMPDGGTLTLSTALLEDAPHSWICLKVADTGTGIAPDIVAKIFDPFFTTKPVGQGTGLGLSLVNEIAKKHAGSVAVESRPGRTVFTVKFPRPATPADSKSR